MSEPELRPKSLFTNYYWHATLSGKNGEILDSILKNGVKPKSALSSDGGNEHTGNTNASYASTDGTGALNYLKNSNGYNWNPGGLPVIIALRVNEITKDYCFDTDISTTGIESDSDVNEKFWYMLVMAHRTIKDACSLNFPSSIYETIKTKMSVLNQGELTENYKKEIWEIIESIKNSSTNDGELDFVSSYQLKKLILAVDATVWSRFLDELNHLGSKGTLARNILKVGGWDQSFIRRVYVISPNGDYHWKKWAELMPANKDFVTNWEKWSQMKYDDKNFFPGNGKLVRII